MEKRAVDLGDMRNLHCPTLSSTLFLSRGGTTVGDVPQWALVLLQSHFPGKKPRRRKSKDLAGKELLK